MNRVQLFTKKENQHTNWILMNRVPTNEQPNEENNEQGMD